MVDAERLEAVGKRLEFSDCLDCYGTWNAAILRNFPCGSDVVEVVLADKSRFVDFYWSILFAVGDFFTGTQHGNCVCPLSIENHISFLLEAADISFCFFVRLERTMVVEMFREEARDDCNMRTDS